MADVKLGQSGSEVTLPTVQWLGLAPEFPVYYIRQIEEKRMSDGSMRYGFYKDQREWYLEWGFITKIQLDSILTLCGHKEVLKFQNNYEDATWYDVVIIYFEYRPARSDVRDMDQYYCRIILRESI